MPEIIENTECILGGPWLLDMDSLKEFDHLMEDEWKRLLAYREVKLAEAVHENLWPHAESFFKWKHKRIEELSEEQTREAEADLLAKTGSSYRYQASKSLVLLFAGEKRMEISTFEAAVREQNCKNDVPVGFTYSLKCADVSCSIQLPYVSGAMKLMTSPDTLPEARELFTVLRSWMEGRRLPLWQRIWANLSGLQWVAFFPIMILLLVASGSGSGKKVYQQQAAELLQGGIDESEKTKALELILTLTGGLAPASQSENFSKVWWWLLSLLIVAILLSIYPKTTLGIGKGQSRIRHWRRWINFAFYAIPAWLLSTFLLPKLEEAVRLLFAR